MLSSLDWLKKKVFNELMYQNMLYLGKKASTCMWFSMYK